ncbi:hypothetical protein DFA_05347 [Cavenderia fasciculata]|uniref:Uncharacterized protein n=1 Tax=Cavenderia fasciculata TaxID=261658 RepID=F4PKZ3_CACFS|nr:uncharacterized protein DFA_05347 [Cavenderia fasciculata]EGG23215.1 hypothetical protein DFA_05347 [Cavenderia fasciculata]|eukprot:XP_004361066.1 hypothetical protein DFA_05347 [Cavenderia fasciculata]
MLEKKKKKKKKNKKKKRLGTPYVEPGTIVEGVNDEHNYTYDYGNVVDPPDEEDDMRMLKVTGNPAADFTRAYSVIGSPFSEMWKLVLPPSFVTMQALLVVASYVLKFPGYGRGTLPNTVKHVLVKMIREVPRLFPDLGIKIRYFHNKYYGLGDQQRTVKWDLAKMSQYLQGNSIRQYSTTRYSDTQDSHDCCIAICKAIMGAIIMKNNQSIYTEEQVKQLLEQEETSVEAALDQMGRMGLPHWRTLSDYVLHMRMYVLVVTLMAFQSGVKNYVSPVLIDGLQTEILDTLEFAHFQFDQDMQTTFNKFYREIFHDTKSHEKAKVMFNMMQTLNLDFDNIPNMEKLKQLFSK